MRRREPRVAHNDLVISDQGQALSGVLQIPPPGTAPGLNWQQLCAWAPQDRVVPVPCVVSIDVEQDQGFSPVNTQKFQRAEPFYMVAPRFGATVTNGNWNDGVNQGALRFRYGAEGFQRERVFDLKSGVYQLPPVQNIEVSVDVYVGAEPLLPQWPVTVRGCIAPCESYPNPTDPTFTGLWRVGDLAPFTVQWVMPPGARGWRWWYGGLQEIEAFFYGPTDAEAPPIHPGVKFFTIAGAGPTGFDMPPGIDFLVMPTTSGLPILTMEVASGTPDEIGMQCVLGL